MSGILDNKTRVLDVILTEEGRSRIMRGQSIAAYYSVTDGQAFYEPDIVSGSTDASTRLYLEAFSSYFDRIVPVSDPLGKIGLFRTIDGIVQQDTVIPSPSLLMTGGLGLTGSYEIFSSASLNSIKNQQLIGSFDEDFYSGEFSISPDYNEYFFNYDDQISQEKRKSNINAMPAIFYDKHFSGFIGYKFLPPLQADTEIELYENLSGFDRPATFEEIAGNTVQVAQQCGNIINLNFEETSEDNNLICQIFETSGSNYNKLSIVDGGQQMIDGKMNKVFYAGKTYLDQRGNYTFARIFTFLFLNE